MRQRLFIQIILGSFFLFPNFTLAAYNHVGQNEDTRLAVPHIWEIPDGVWQAPWSGACEEASIIMVEQFYLHPGKRTLSRVEAKSLMSPLFPIEDRLFGSNADTNSTRTLKLINDFSSFDATIKFYPTIEDIKNELTAGHPVITLHYGYDLNNPRHRFRRGGSSYHMMALTGFDDQKKIFFANDSELKDGLDFPYDYAIIMASLHDFNHTTRRANGEPVVLFTRPKMLVKAVGSNRIFLVRGKEKQYITSPAVFKTHRLSWKLVKTISASELAKLSDGESIVN